MLSMNEVTDRIENNYYKPGSGFEYPAYAEGPTAQHEIDKVSKRLAYKAETRRLEQTLFKNDALEAVGLLNHPKAEKAWNMAYHTGHSMGLYEVLLNLKELADLIL